MVHLNRIFLVLCLLCVGSSYAMTREGINARKAELTSIEKSLRTANTSTKILLLEKAQSAILYLRTAASSDKFKANALSSIESPFSFQGTLLSGSRPAINDQLAKMQGIVAIKQKNAAKQLEACKQKEYNQKMNALVNEATDLTIDYEKELSELLKKLRRK